MLFTHLQTLQVNNSACKHLSTASDNIPTPKTTRSAVHMVQEAPPYRKGNSQRPITDVFSIALKEE